jgi:hypothetical protein
MLSLLSVQNLRLNTWQLTRADSAAGVGQAGVGQTGGDGRLRWGVVRASNAGFEGSYPVEIHVVGLFGAELKLSCRILG